MKPRAYGPFPYSPVNKRPKGRWPNGARVALWVIPNIEFFALTDMIPASAGGGGKVPDVSGWGARDYGNRIGVFRMMEVMDRYGVRGSVALNANLCAEHPEIIEACMERKWELMGHNETNTKRLNEVPPEEEAAIIRRTVEKITAASGVAPRGWLGSGLQETWNTLEYLVDNGIEYVLDWVNDDQPYKMTLDDGRTFMHVPYSTEINDKPIFDKYHRTAPQFEEMMRDQFDVLWREGDEQPRVMGIALHPYITGVPHRIGALDRALDYMCRHEGVWRATGSEIADAWRKMHP